MVRADFDRWFVVEIEGGLISARPLSLLKMKTNVRSQGSWAVFFSLVFGLFASQGGDFKVETPGGQYQFLFNGQPVSTLTLVRGQTYTFDVQTTYQHPLHIESPGVVNNDITSGVITYAVPTNAANYSFSCGIHPWMFGDIITIAPAERLPIRILNLAVGNNLVLTSTATNDLSVQAEFTTNAMSGNWYALTVQTNRVVNGNLETICGRPEGEVVFVRIRAAR